jgi:hypothetical protein
MRGKQMLILIHIGLIVALLHQAWGEYYMGFSHEDCTFGPIHCPTECSYERNPQYTLGCGAPYRGDYKCCGCSITIYECWKWVDGQWVECDVPNVGSWYFACTGYSGPYYCDENTNRCQPIQP